MHGEQPVGVADLYQLVGTGGFFKPQLGDGSERSRKIRLGIKLRSKADMVFGPYRIMRVGVATSPQATNRGSAVFKLEPVTLKSQ